MSTINLAVRSNPYEGAYSSYSKWEKNKLVRASNTTQNLSPLARLVHDQFRAHVSEPDFSCVGAKAAINGNCYRFGFYTEMNTAPATVGLAHDLWTFVQERPAFGSDYATFIACFAAPLIADEQAWENLLWAQLQSLHEIDCFYYDWDSTVSSDPESPDFSFSFGETAFFIVGLHPGSPRISRRFPWATLVFNAHAQFERLREKNQFERMRQTIRARELKLQGSLNPNLSNYGERSEAKQYSGRAVEENWRCPFRARLGKADQTLD